MASPVTHPDHMAVMVSLRHHVITYGTPLIIVLSLAYPALTSDDGPLLFVFRAAMIALIGLAIATGLHMWRWMRRLDSALNDSDAELDEIRAALTSHLLVTEINSWPDSRRFD